MQDRHNLSIGNLLSADHISAANILLRQRFPAQNGLKDTSYLAIKQEWNSDPQDFVQIIFIDPGHWARLSNKFCELGEVELFDSMLSAPSEDCPITKQACCITKSQNTTESSLTINVIGVQTQIGGADCGLFSISMAFDLCCGIDPFTQRVDQDQMRTHLLQCFEKEEITSFPKVQRKGLVTMRRVVNSITVELYCICRGPDFPRMACCDSCHAWFHKDCLNIPKEVFEDEEIPWKCPDCREC